MSQLQPVLTWAGLIAVIAVPTVAATMSPLLAWREPAYIIAGFAGIIALVLLLFQPILARGYLPGLSRVRSRKTHRWVGIGAVLAVLIHVTGLWLTSPPDVIDALLFRSPTLFSPWGVVSMWALFLSGFIVAMRRKLPLTLKAWRRVHRILAVIIVIGSVVHAMLIDGTMETISKTLLCVAVIGAMLMALNVAEREV